MTALATAFPKKPGFFLAMLIWATVVGAQEYPARTITMLCWTEPGSAVDVYARAMAPLLARELGQSVVVENRPGADGIVMINQMLKMPADGYTIAANTMTLALLFGQPNANLKVSDLQMIARTQIDAYGLVVPTASPLRSIDEFVRFARQNPQKLNVGGPFEIGAHRVAWEVFAEAANFRVNWIPYKGGGPAMIAVAGGHVDAVVTNPGNVKAYIAAGKVRVVAVSSDQRLADFPDAPTFKERGWDVVRYQWRGVMAKAGTPDAIVARLMRAIRAVRDTPEMRAYLKQVMTSDGFLDPKEFTEQLRRDIAELEAMKKKLGID